LRPALAGRSGFPGGARSWPAGLFRHRPRLRPPGDAGDRRHPHRRRAVAAGALSEWRRRPPPWLGWRSSRTWRTTAASGGLRRLAVEVGALAGSERIGGRPDEQDLHLFPKRAPGMDGPGRNDDRLSGPAAMANALDLDPHLALLD